MTDQRRRKTDQGTDVTNLLLGAESPRDREFVAAMVNISKDLIANTAATNLIVEQLTELRTEFAEHKKILDAHARAEEALLNKSRGAAWLLPVIFVMAQGVILFLWKDLQNDISSLSVAQKEDVQAHSVLDKRITTIDQSLHDLRELHK